MPDFVDVFEPEKGELLYGLRDTRTAYLTAWEGKARNDDMNRLVEFLTLENGQKPNWNIIDNFNDFFFLGGHVDFSSSAKKSAVPWQLYARLQAIESVVRNDANRVCRIEQRATYAQQLASSRFSPASVFDASNAKLAQEGFTKKFKPDGRKKIGKEAALQQNRSYLAIRRACKFGIGMAATHAAFGGNKLHFLLDGLDLEEVARKKQRQGYGGRTSVSITTSEIRYVYRNWAKLRNVVRFYVNLTQVNPPWEEDWSRQPLPGTSPNPFEAHKDLWDAYGNARLVKYSNAIPDKALI